MVPWCKPHLTHLCQALQKQRCRQSRWHITSSLAQRQGLILCQMQSGAMLV